MSKITKFHGESGTKLVLDQPANSGDFIDVSETVSFDLSAVKTQFKSEINKVAEQIASKLVNDKVEKAKLEAKNEYINKISQQEAEIKTLKDNLPSQIAAAKAEEKVKNLEDKTKEIEEIRKKHQDELVEKEDKYNALSNEYEGYKKGKTPGSTKQIGEWLEKDLKQEFDNAQALGSFNNCTFEKINIAKEVEGDIKKRKADFLFICYSEIDKSKPQDQWPIIFKVVIEAKNHDEKNDGTENNAKFYERLYKNQLNEKAKYALLVSTLEMNDSKFDSIFQPAGYNNMYVIRPWNLMQLLRFLVDQNMEKKSEIVSRNDEIFTMRDKFIEEYTSMLEDSRYNSELAQEHALNALKCIVDNIKTLKKLGKEIVDWSSQSARAANKIQKSKFVSKMSKGKDFTETIWKLEPYIKKHILDEDNTEEKKLIESTKKLEDQVNKESK